MTPRRQCLLDTTGLMHTCAHRDCAAHKRPAQVHPRQGTSTEGEADRHGVPALTKKLPAIDIPAKGKISSLQYLQYH